MEESNTRAGTLLFEVEKDFQFEAAHYFGEGDDPAQRQLHGHSFAGTVRIVGDPRDETGWIRDLWKIQAVLDAKVVRVLDHALLNEVQGLERPALEQIARWVFARLEPELPGLDMVEVRRPTLGERARVRRA